MNHMELENDVWTQTAADAIIEEMRDSQLDIDDSEKHGNSFFYGLLLLLQCVFWGIGNPVLKISVTAISPFYCLTFRFLLAFLIFAVFFGKRIWVNFTLRSAAAISVMAFFNAASFVFASFAMLKTTATATGFFMSTTVLFTPIYSVFLLKTKLKRTHILPIVIVLAGLYLLSTQRGETLTFDPGSILGILCAAAGSMMIVLSARIMPSSDTVYVTAFQAAMTGVWCLIFAFIFEDFPNLSEVSLTSWAAILYMAVGCTGIAYLIQNHCLKHVSATYVALIFCSEPIFTVIASYFLLGEMLTMRSATGAAIVMVSIVIASLSPAEEPHIPQKAPLNTENSPQ